jgi:hypothetical protein
LYTVDGCKVQVRFAYVKTRNSCSRNKFRTKTLVALGTLLTLDQWKR